MERLLKTIRIDLLPPQILNNKIKCKKDWDKFKEKLKITAERGVSFTSNIYFYDTVSFDDGLNEFNESYKKGKYMVFGTLTGLDLVQRYVGIERLLIAIIADPDWVKEMFWDNAKFILNIYDHMEGNGYKFDGVFIYNDLGYKNSSLISPRH